MSFHIVFAIVEILFFPNQGYRWMLRHLINIQESTFCFDYNPIKSHLILLVATYDLTQKYAKLL